jgi:hypothetical protein
VSNKQIGWLLALVFLAACTASLMTLIAKNIAPWSCPTEDSCAVNYRNGSWHVEKTSTWNDPTGLTTDWPAMKIVAG